MNLRALLIACLATPSTLLLPAASMAQTPAPPAAPPIAGSTPANSAMDANLMYQLLLGEMQVQGGEPGTGFSLILDAARKTNDPRLYQRAVEIALRARSGDSALQASRAWKGAQPNSRDANRSLLQVLLLLNRVGETVEPLKADMALAPAAERAGGIVAIAQLYSRVTDKKLAASVVEQGLAAQLSDPATGAVAWTMVGRLRLAAGDREGAFQAAQQGQAANQRSTEPVALALELMDPKFAPAEALVVKHLADVGTVEVRMGYARALLDAQRESEAAQQLQVILKDRPGYAEAWLVQGVLQSQGNRLADADRSLKRYLELAATESARPGAEVNRGPSQAYLALAQVAEKRKDFAAAEQWLARIPDAAEMMGAQARRASILAKQGRMDQALALLRALPERNPAEARAKLNAEVGLLRENKRYQAAYDLLVKATAADPKDTDLVYDLAMMAEKIGKMDEMELRLRELIAARPNFHHAYNALGYSLADRNQRLPEAKQLILKALEHAPGDPYITDSLAWVEFRMGNKAEALRLLDGAYKMRPDAEIAAHLGEVLWSMGQKERANAIWREGMLLNAENETLVETLLRLRVQP
jgi:tetratricopeptide (TPR) repeat protein